MRPVPSPQDALDRLVRLIHRHLTDDLRRSPWRGSADPLAGHCFVASEAIYYLLGGRAAGWKPLSMRHEGAPHWLLRHEPSGRVVDATEWQFRTPPDVACAVGKGFMSSRPDTPSARARELMRRVRADADGPRLIVAAFAGLSGVNDGLGLKNNGATRHDYRDLGDALVGALDDGAAMVVLRRLASSYRGLDIEVGWSAGGCYILADAFQRWWGSDCRLVQVSDRSQVLHVAAVVGDTCFDADGATPWRYWSGAWLDGHPERSAGDLEPRRATRSIPHDEADVGAMERVLRARLGDPAAWRKPAVRANPGGASAEERASYDRIASSVDDVNGRPEGELRSAAGGLQIVGMGGHRVVFAIDDRRVLKVATDLGMLEPDERGQNTVEADRWRGASDSERTLMAPVLARADDDSWLVMARTRPVTALTNDQRRRFMTITDDVVLDNVGELDGRLVLHDYGRDARLRHRWNGRGRTSGASLPEVVFHGTPHAFDELRPSDTGLFWFALDREVAERFSVHRSYVPAGNAAVWETRLAAGARIVDLADLTDTNVRALKENYSSTAYASRYGAKLSDEDWVRRYANFDLLEGERGIVQFLRARRIDGAVVDDNLKGEPFRSLAIWNRRAIGPSARVALDQATQDAARSRLRPSPPTRSNPPAAGKPRKLPKGFATIELPAGTDLWRGSANPDDWSESWQWFTDDAFAARGYMEGRDHEWGIVSFDTKKPLRLVSLGTYKDLDRLAARLGLRDYDGDPHDVAPAVCEIAGIDGWFIKEGDHDGADILLCAPDAIRPIAGVDQSDDWDWTPWPGY
jgi:hypothetical protein